MRALPPRIPGGSDAIPARTGLVWNSRYMEHDTGLVRVSSLGGA